jgi:hypothetical protein
MMRRSKTPPRSLRRLAGATGLTMLLAASPLAADDGPEPVDMLLHSKFGELCTMCEATVVCASRDVSAVSVDDLIQPTAGPYTLYHFHTKTFLGQIATIYDFLIRWIEPVITEKRPLTIYEIPAAGEEAAGRGRIETSVELSRNPPMITVGQRQIERHTREWRSLDGEVLGACRRLPLRETWDYLQTNGPWPERTALSAGGDAK